MVVTSILISIYQMLFPVFTCLFQIAYLTSKKMELEQAIRLLTYIGISSSNKTAWADLGSGRGLFTRALASLLAPGSTITAVDTDAASLGSIQSTDGVVVKKVRADFVQDTLALGELDGILMANSLHYVQDKNTFIKKMERCLGKGGQFLIVEYDMDKPNPWVPYPVSFETLKELFSAAGYAAIHRIADMPSIYNRSKIYSAVIGK